jgi:hypothetical protein
MFGIFTHAQLRRGRFWDSLSRQLQQRGPDYIERCTFRNAPLSTGDYVILPALFSSSPYQVQDIPQVAPLVKVSEEDMKEVSGMASMFRMRWLSTRATDPLYARVRSPAMSQFLTTHIAKLV